MSCVALALAGLCLLAGCQGSGQVQIAALNFRAIDPPPPRFWQLDQDRCYWWTDEDGHVWVAMERDQRSLVLGEMGRLRFQISLALGEPPAGKTREYLLSRRELRAAIRFGPMQSRWTSLSGILALYRESQDRLRGSFRLDVACEVQQLLGGWGNASRYVMMGTFTAVHDEIAGRRIAADTESLGLEREPLASQPVSQPAARPASQPASRG
jgi:hypothetical protein